MFADNRGIREDLYKAFSTRASENDMTSSKWDNSLIMGEILNLRAKKSTMLGYKNYAELSIATKMANKTSEVLEFLYDLVYKSKAKAQTEYNELCDFAKSCGHTGALEAWDTAYYTEKLKKSLFDFTQDELRNYFPESRVLHGIFKILHKIYGITVVEVERFDKYNEDIRLFSFKDESGEERGKIYLDLYSRDNKRGGAWMDECRVRYEKPNGEIQLPVAYLTCNFARPLENSTSTLTHTDVVTLFHEFGHALHHILTKVNDIPVSGINGVEWDAVELPSQFMENFCWSASGLKLISLNINDGSTLPKSLFEKLIKSRKFHSGLHMLRQLEFAIFDFKMHMDSTIQSAEDIQNLLDSVREEVAIKAPPYYNKFQNSFSHIFAGGYSAGYYSYKWAEVLSSDAFSKFEERGNVLCKKTGLEFLTCILEKGGSKGAKELFFSFRGREASNEALLNHVGIRN
jgi:oligopeptidase A